MAMKITMYIYSSQAPTELTLLRCLRCTRPLFKVNSEHILLSNAYGAGAMDLPPHSNMQEHQCYSCKALYSILFQ